MKTTYEVILAKMKQFCAYRERSHQEVRHKLLKEEVYGDDLEQIMAVLIEENFLNEERFAKAYVSGKFRQNKWGRNKIRMELKRFNVSSYCERKAFDEIDEEEYYQVAQDLWEKKLATLKGGNTYQNKQKVIKYMLGKGYEYEVVKEISGS